MPGFPGVVLIPLGRLQTLTNPLLARGACCFITCMRELVTTVAPSIRSESIEAVAIGRQASVYEKR